MSEQTVLVSTTRERLDALRRHLSNQFLGHKKDEELVRALLVDMDTSNTVVRETRIRSDV